MLTDMKPIEHFKELIKAAIAHQRVKTSSEAEYYLSNLLTGFIESEKLSTFPSASEDEPLAITFLKAFEKGLVERAALLRHLGDSSLFVSGFFSDSLTKKLVSIDYYIDMGSTAYGCLADNSRDETSPLFRELSDKFIKLVDVLAEVSEVSRLTSSQDILRLYEKWLRTGSEHAVALLRELGIEPLQVTTEPVH
jgi:hypothetical protein